METQETNKTPILELAWRKFAQFDDTSVKRTASYTNLRKWIAVIGVFATLFAILYTIYPQEGFPKTGRLIIQIFLVASPILASALAAFTSTNFATGDWLIARAGAEETLKDIYLYRTILKNNPKRREWLEKRLAKIQRSVYRGMNGELVMEAYKGEVPPPPRFDPKFPNCDPGFNDLSGDEYFKYRLENELNWHVKKINQKQKERIRLQVFILISGVAGAFLAAFSGTNSTLALWVALTASITTTLLGWQELKNLDLVVRNYSKVIMELTIISDHWKNLEAEERTKSEIYRMVNSTEDILWSRNVEYIKAMQEALKESNLDEEASLINRVIQEQREVDRRFRKDLEDVIVAETTETMESASEKLTEAFEEAFGSLAEEASSDVVQAELAAMREAIQNFGEQLAQRLGLSNSLQTIAADYKDVDVNGDTPRGVLNDLLARYPKTHEIKG
ncbi:MAG: SLATT domain-containing protein [Anaerolineales bacterium]|nr:SLATT domain-containing protein [Anaerolineales bacterium]